MFASTPALRLARLQLLAGDRKRAVAVLRALVAGTLQLGFVDCDFVAASASERLDGAVMAC